MINRDISYWRCLLREGVAVVVESPLMVQPVMYAVDSPYPQMPPDCLLTALIKWKTITAAEVLAMINAGADVNAKVIAALLRFTRRQETDTPVIPILIQAGANVNATIGPDLTPLHIAAIAASNGYAQIIPILVKAGADINARSYGGRTPLDGAKKEKHWDVAKALKDAGAK